MYDGASVDGASADGASADGASAHNLNAYVCFLRYRTCGREPPSTLALVCFDISHVTKAIRAVVPSVSVLERIIATMEKKMNAYGDLVCFSFAVTVGNLQ